MNFKEITLENLIYEASQTEEGKRELEEVGLEIKGKLYRQLDFGSYGRADLVEMITYPERVVFVVYELKQEIINSDTLFQAYRYKRALEDFSIAGISVEVSVVLIGKRINSVSDWVYVLPSIFDIAIYTYDFTIHGLKFKEENLSYYKSGNNKKTLGMLEQAFQEEIDSDKESTDDKDNEDGI